MSDLRTPAQLRFLVTGASGFIGSRLALHAHRAGMDVLATGRAETPLELERLRELRAAEVPVVEGLLQEASLVRRLVRDRNIVIHLAAAQHESHMPRSYFHTSNVEVVRLLLEECAQAGIERFVYGSTIGVYGDAADRVLDETSPVDPDNMYTQTKLEAESLVRAQADRLPATIVRIGETYGPGDFRLLKLFRAIDRGRFIMLGDGSNLRQCIHVNDLIRGVLLAAQHPDAVAETFILAGREAMTTTQMVERIARALGRTPPRARLPLWPFVLAGALLETTLRPLRIEPPLHRRRLDFFRKSLVFSIEKAQRTLGFEPQIDFLTGAMDTARWYRARGELSARTHEPVTHPESA
ncbi:MAG TPA: NAD(P)-dependent oxidoreductase [Steroidobacteraceae bacterium]